MPADETKDRLIAAAGQVFAQDGFQRAGIRQICQICDANVASVKYHFGSKEGLYREVLLTAGRDLMSRRPLPDLPESSDPRAMFETLLRHFLRLTLIDRHNHPIAGCIMKHELREPTAALDDLVKLFIKPVHRRAAQIIARLTGGQPESPEVLRVTTFVLGMCANLETARPLIQRLGVRIPDDEAGVDAFAGHVIDFVLHGVLGAAATTATKPTAKTAQEKGDKGAISKPKNPAGQRAARRSRGIVRSGKP